MLEAHRHHHGPDGFVDALTVAVGLLVGLGTFFGRLDRARPPALGAGPGLTAALSPPRAARNVRVLKR